MWCGYLHLLLVSPRGAVDPIEKSKAKVECYTAEVSKILRCIEFNSIQIRFIVLSQAPQPSKRKCLECFLKGAIAVQ